MVDPIFGAILLSRPTWAFIRLPELGMLLLLAAAFGRLFVALVLFLVER